MATVTVVSLFGSDIGKVVSFSVVCGTTPFDLSGASISMLLNDGRSFPLSIVSAGSGTARHVISATDFLNRGRFYLGQLQVFASGGKVFNTGKFEIHVNKTVA